jgi:hypothetical protein
MSWLIGGSCIIDVMFKSVDDHLMFLCMKYQMDEIQSGPLMVKSLTGGCFGKSKWLSGLVAPTM